MKPIETCSEKVRTTVVKFHKGKITTYKRNNFTVFAFSGKYSKAMIKKFEQFTMKTVGSVGIDMSAYKGICPSVVPILERIRRHLESRKYKLILLDPPMTLTELLELRGLSKKYSGEDQDDNKRKKSEDSKNVPEREMKRFLWNLRKNKDIDRGFENAENRISSFMPKALPIFPEYRFSAYWRACDRIGGDFYDFIPLTEDSIGIALGDVSGHGLPAAIFMGIAKKVLRLRAQEMSDATPAEILTQVNKDLFFDLAKGTFVTIFYGILNTKNNEIIFSRAGHEPPLFFHADGRRPEILTSKGLAIGIAPSKIFEKIIEDFSLKFKRGEGLLMFTDGVFDSINEKEVRFGKERLIETVSASEPSDSIRDLLSQLEKFTGNSNQVDDITLIAFGRKSKTAEK